MKKILSKFLCTVMTAVLCMGSVGVNPDLTISAETNSDYMTSGDLKYQKVDKDEDGTYDYVEITDSRNSVTSVTEVDIPAEIDGLPVTEISSMAFWNCSNLTSITIPNSVTKIGIMAFCGCTGLTGITIPDSVTEIGDNAFSGTPWLETKKAENPFVVVNSILIDGTICSGDVEIPDSVTSIGYGAFYNCSNLTSITIPDSVTSIGSGAFSGCTSLTSINVSENSQNYSSKNGVLFNKDKTKLIQFTAGKTDKEYTIPDSVTSIGNSAFYNCTSLTNITISDSVTSIGGYAFSGCTSLTSITIPDSVTGIGIFAFKDCPLLKSVTILNPDCEIDDLNNSIIRNGCIWYEEYIVLYYNGIIRGYEGSTAQAYAKKCCCEFEAIDQPEPISVSGAVLLKKYLMNLIDDVPEEYDLNADGSIDVFDIAILRKRLLDK